MSFEKTVKIPADRVGSLIGKSGIAKSGIEEACLVRLDVDGQTGEVRITSNADPAVMQPFKATEIVMAVGRGFSPERAMSLLKGERALHVMDLREFAGRSPAQLERIRGRIIGERGRARRNMEELTGAAISVYGRTVSIIGGPQELRAAVDAVSALCSGRMHGTVYGRLEAARRREKAERLKLWEGSDVF